MMTNRLSCMASAPLNNYKLLPALISILQTRNLTESARQLNVTQSAIELLVKTDTLLTTPLHIAADFAQTYDLRIIALPIALKPQQYYLLRHAKHHQDPEHTWFRELCHPFLKNHLERTKTLGMKLLHTYK
ncbi:type 2 periplasmic-binding domain-containing protein [Moritella yayanosii]|uniref:Uncharacterized protein n=1 Tax=Moritella yayanosii TaxID=69539 RepID=A0A330LRD0_9GAMM|nr:hypothetical protein [Moritella yayanosii]SQD78511.1 protein of unknown function, might belong to LysR family transcriptional regulator [Moritella yayanosii]